MNHSLGLCVTDPISNTEQKAFKKKKYGEVTL